MDLSAITDIKELKALAYDQLAEKARVEHNLALITQRIEQVQQELEQEQKDSAIANKEDV